MDDGPQPHSPATIGRARVRPVPAFNVKNAVQQLLCPWRNANPISTAGWPGWAISRDPENRQAPDTPSSGVAIPGSPTTCVARGRSLGCQCGRRHPQSASLGYFSDRLKIQIIEWADKLTRQPNPQAYLAMLLDKGAQ